MEKIKEPILSLSRIARVSNFLVSGAITAVAVFPAFAWHQGIEFFAEYPFLTAGVALMGMSAIPQLIAATKIQKIVDERKEDKSENIRIISGASTMAGSLFGFIASAFIAATSLPEREIVPQRTMTQKILTYNVSP